MRKNSCMECQYYKHKETVFDGYKEELGGLILTPKEKVIEHHCTKHPRRFKVWWEANKDKTRENVGDVPKCFQLHESIKPLDNMIRLMEEILDKIDKEC